MAICSAVVYTNVRRKPFCIAFVYTKLALLALLLTGCATQLPHEVRIPVPVSCIDSPIPKPDWPTDAQLKALDDYHLAIELWLNRRLRQLYEAQLEAQVAGCS